MTNSAKPRVLVVGAGSIGTVLGYRLTLAKADVTFLVRSSGVERLSCPQTLYSYTENKLEQFDDYSVITDHAAIAEGRFDYIVITLDGASLKSADGVALVKAIGKAVAGTDTKVIQASMFVGSRDWFKEMSGLRYDEFTTGYFSFLSYPPSAVTLPVHGDIDTALLAKADLAYLDNNESAMMVTDETPAIARGFAELYNASGVSRVAVIPPEGIAMFANAIFAMFAGCDLLGWPKFTDIDPKNETWKLTVAAMKEIMSLSIHGEAGRQAAEATTEESVLKDNAAVEQQTLPIDLQEFNRFHHGGKVNKQDRNVLEDSLAVGEAEGKDMPALSELFRRYSSELPIAG